MPIFVNVNYFQIHCSAKKFFRQPERFFSPYTTIKFDLSLDISENSGLLFFSTLIRRSGGMKVALLTTVFGLITAMILQVFYNYLLTRIDAIVNDMEDATISFMDILVKNK